MDQRLPGRGPAAGPRKRGATGFFTRREWGFIYVTGLLLTGILVGGYIYSLGVGRNVEHARAMALAILCLYSAFLTALLSRLHGPVPITITAASA